MNTSDDRHGENGPEHHRSNSARFMQEGVNGSLAHNRAMSQTFTKLPGCKIPQVDQVIDKIRESQRKQLKVLKAHLVKKDKNQVTLAMGQFKAK